MDPHYWAGDDDRDTLDPGSDDCPDCGAGYDEQCDPECLCRYCVEVRARLAALRALDIAPEDAA